jgi:hypothetical protein
MHCTAFHRPVILEPFGLLVAASTVHPAVDNETGVGTIQKSAVETRRDERPGLTVPLGSTLDRTVAVAGEITVRCVADYPRPQSCDVPTGEHRLDTEILGEVEKFRMVDKRVFQLQPSH